MLNLMLWLIPRNDGESVEIRRLLDEHHNRFLLTHQGWGANWKELEQTVRNGIAGEPAVYAIELAGEAPSNATNIDHHDYSDDHSRINPLCSLEQVARILGARLNRWRQLVAANDRGYIRAMEEELEASAAEIAAVRLQDRRAQGVTRENEIEAWNVVRCLEPQQELWKVPVSGKINSAYGDLLYTARKAREWLLQSEAAWTYSGPRHRQLMTLALPETHWSGGDRYCGFFGISSPGPSSRDSILNALQF
jgi:hypothetical protein